MLCIFCLKVLEVNRPSVDTFAFDLSILVDTLIFVVCLRVTIPKEWIRRGQILLVGVWSCHQSLFTKPWTVCLKI